MVKIALDAGHGMNTPGKRTPAGEREWSFNNIVLLGCWRKLEKIPGVQLRRTDDFTGKTDVSLSRRVNQANAWGADVFVSFHHNALAGSWHNGGGSEVYSYPGSTAGAKLARLAAPKVAAAMGIRNRGAKTANFQVIRETRMPGILVEGGFMDSRVDIVPMRNDAKLRAQGEAVADAIIEHLGLKKPVHASKPASAPTTIDYGTYMYGQVIRNGMGGAAVKRSQGDLNKLGYKVAEDGRFGPATEAAWRSFQKDNGLEVDGIAGIATQAMMKKKLAELNKPKPTGSIYRVKVNGKQVGAYRDGDNILDQAQRAIKNGATNIEIEKA